jgi:hypothetical protein
LAEEDRRAVGSVPVLEDVARRARDIRVVRCPPLLDAVAGICLPRWPGSAAPLWANQVEDLVGVVADAEILG